MHEYMGISKVLDSLEVQERVRVYLQPSELHSHPSLILPQEPMSTWNSWKELRAHIHAVEWYFMKRTHKNMEVLMSTPKEQKFKSL
jgi:hypothetical protein